MSVYSQRVRESVLPLSVANTLPSAFTEWSFTENTVDHETPIETCELCGQQKLRYHFEIANHLTAATLWVGSHCILQFDVAILENGLRLSPDQAKRHLDKLTQLMQLNSCIRALEQLAAKENNPILSGALKYYRRNNKLTPKYAAVVFWKLQRFRIDHHPSFFQIELRRDQHIADLRAMPTRRVHRFWRALSSAQRIKAQALGHSVPNVGKRGS
ncbi:hypothetical protein [Erythrobacter sp. QSSC1-22B]|uniref:hypothetical protein n=1 Tax=Erythrobacter sp. QSSC1-22B TaxID=1860125 RepID=UPI000AAF7856|nr:hypothetical protein [Erythrobacter sp. QSSC1-22B]